LRRIRKEVHGDCRELVGGNYLDLRGNGAMEGMRSTGERLMGTGD
jgi:hypothetical protein